jgi:nitrous oxide reductase
MSGVNRRSFLAAGAGTAAGAVLAMSGSHAGAATAAASGVSERADMGGVDGVVVHISDARRGEATIMGYGTEVVVVDPALVAAVARAARSGKRG